MLIHREPASSNQLARHKTSNTEERASRNPLYLRCGTCHTDPRAFQLSCSISFGTRAKSVPIEDREGTGAFKWHGPRHLQTSMPHECFISHLRRILSLSLPGWEGKNYPCTDSWPQTRAWLRDWRTCQVSCHRRKRKRWTDSKRDIMRKEGCSTVS